MSELGQVTGLLLLLGEEDMRGSYYRMGTKDTVEGCLKLPTSALKESIGYLFEEDSPPLWGGRLEWSNGSKVTTLLTRHGDGVRLRLRYITTKRNGEKVESDYPVLMTYTVPNYGGRRWWFICPLSVNGVPCGF